MFNPLFSFLFFTLPSIHFSSSFVFLGFLGFGFCLSFTWQKYINFALSVLSTHILWYCAIQRYKFSASHDFKSISRKKNVVALNSFLTCFYFYSLVLYLNGFIFLLIFIFQLTSAFLFIINEILSVWSIMLVYYQSIYRHPDITCICIVYGHWTRDKIEMKTEVWFWIWNYSLRILNHTIFNIWIFRSWNKGVLWWSNFFQF